MMSLGLCLRYRRACEVAGAASFASGADLGHVG